jgi:hypothetical protein
MKLTAPQIARGVIVQNIYEVSSIIKYKWYNSELTLSSVISLASAAQFNIVIKV